MDITQLKAQYKAGERNFSGAQLSGVSLVWVELTGVNFEGADLSYANLSGANLSESNFSSEANLTFADLSRADLRNTNLKGTRLEGANLEGIQLEGAVYDGATKFPLGFDPIRAGAIAERQESAFPQKATTRSPQPAVNQQTEAVAEVRQSAPKEGSKPQAKEPEQLKRTSPSIFDPKPTVEAAKEILQKVRGATVEAINDWQEAKQPNWGVAQSTQTLDPQQSLIFNTSGQGKSAVVPASIKGSWNWGALMLPWVWFLSNRIWGGLSLWLFMWIPNVGGLITFVFAIAMAANGNTWAWQGRKWNSVEAFKKHQRGWALAGIMFWILKYLFRF
jgi:Pentapeptide repeats (8 copies)